MNGTKRKPHIWKRGDGWFCELRPVTYPTAYAAYGETPLVAYRMLFAGVPRIKQWIEGVKT